MRIEGFNVFNQKQFGFPTTDITSATFGAINGMQTSYRPRTVQSLCAIATGAQGEQIDRNEGAAVGALVIETGSAD